MHLGEIINNVNAEASPATGLDTLIKRLANRGQKRFVSISPHRFSWMILNNLSLTTAASVGEYTLSPLVDTTKLITIRDTDRKRPIAVIARQEFQNRFPDPTDNEGDPEVAYLSGFSPVANQPSSASTLSLVSTSASDVSKTVKIEGTNSSGVLIGEEIVLTGTTPVVSVNSYVRILGRSITDFITGVLTITSNAGAVTVDTIGQRNRQGKYPKLTFYPTPSSVKTLTYDATMLLPDLVNSNDMSLIPEQYHDAIEDYVLYKIYRLKKDYQAAGEALAGFKGRIAEAISDDCGPERLTTFCGEQRLSYLGEGRFQGLWPKGY